MASVTLPNERCVNIIQGEFRVDNDPRTKLTTILGSCVAACLWDSVAGLGGMNHFLLPGIEGKQTQPVGAAMRHGVHAMELLVNGLLQKGADRRRLQAKLFGGARMIKGLTDIGDMNAGFAERFLRAEGITIVGGSLRGEQGRRIQFWPASGRAAQVFIGLEQTASRNPPAAKPIASAGALELF
ncbi:MAG: chemotaxis protein CheD [Acidocella sp. 20-57-95]|nr:MAG: chemotaxis protein CheD [Acidocella sp. 20-57-95]OYV59560.1 MAG: chemotaxis protein CheD [Acidocella sp. 21-58-7]HQT63331.1 chemotaxis protein CheD [Acidocella sp.]HQU04594.1 chemotaxis protein CheD [Acidocella sp.]